MMHSGQKRGQLALLAIAIIFHVVGIVGIGVLHNSSVLTATPFHMLLMGSLLILSFRYAFPKFIFWSAAVAAVCFAAEWVGVHYGWLFGGYQYGGTLGVKWQDIPLVIGLNWVLVAAGAISVTEKLKLPALATVFIAASLATAYDWLLEPLAIRLHYWHWNGGQVPAWNYICWWMLSALSALLWLRLKLKGNLFSAGLFLIQIAFFIVLRALL